MKKTLKRVLAFLSTVLLLVGNTLPVIAVENQVLNLTVEAEHGTVIVSDEAGRQLLEGMGEIKVKGGQKLSVTVRPDDGYQLDALLMNDEKLEVEENRSECTMPKQDTVICAKFSEENKQKETEATEKNQETEQEKIFFSEDTDYAQISRRPYEEIDWSAYGDGGITDPATKKVLEEKGIDLSDENYGTKLEEKLAEEQEVSVQNRNSKSLEEIWAVGTVHTGDCEITNAWFVPEEGQSYFELGNFSGELAGAEMIGSGWCADHTAAEPPAGHPVVQVDGTVTAVDFNSGSVDLNLLVTPEGVTDGSSNENGLTGYQHIGAKARMRVDFGGYLELRKKSANPELTSNNSCYSLEGAEYGVFQGEKQVATLRTDVNGYARSEKLPSGDYTVKELTPPKGFALDMQSYNVKITSNVTTLEVIDYPQSDPVSIVLGKIDKETNKDKPQGSSSLAGAEFTVKYYKGFHDTDPATKGIKAERIWKFKTDEKGICLFSEKFKLPSDPFYLSSFGAPTIPLGTITIQETKAPKGYLINPEIFIRRIEAQGNAEIVETYNVPTIPETIIHGGVLVEKWDSELNKKDPQGGASLKGTRLDLISENEHEVLVKGKTYKKGDVITTLTTDQDGKAQTEKNLLPFGTYKIKEKTPPSGYQNAGILERTFRIEKDQTLVKLNTKDTAIKDKVIRGGVEIEKWDSELDKKEPQGGASLKGTQFDIISENEHAVFVKGKTYQKGGVITTLTTDQDGKAQTEKDLLPFGTYRVKEKTPPSGYQNAGILERTFQIKKNQTLVKLNTKDTAIKDKVIRGGVAIEKWDSELDKKEPQGGANLKGAKFDLISENEHVVFAKGKTYKKGDVITTLTTDQDGKAQTEKDLLPFGTYRVKEKTPPSGYQNTGILERTFKIEKNQVIVKLNTTDTAIKNDVIRGGVEIEKWDNELDQNVPQGNATLEGAVFEISNQNEHPVKVEGKLYKKGEVVKTLTTDKSGKASTAKDLLPYGTYQVREVKAPEGYNPTGETRRTFSIKENGKIVKLNTTDTAIKNDVIRGDLQLVKFKESSDEDEDQKTPLEGIIFEITSKTTKKTVEIVTDKHGYASTTQLNAGKRGNLAYDTYIVHEKNPPEGTKPVKDFEVTIQNEGETLYYILEDKLVVSPVRLAKLDAETGKIIPLANAEFQLLDKNKKPIEMTTHYPTEQVHKTFKTDESGTFTLPEKLPAGTYYFKEIHAPEGYLLNGQEIRFEIKEGHDWTEPVLVQAKDLPAKGQIRIRKSDETNGEVLEGASFEIKAKKDIVTPDGTIRVKKGEVVDTITTEKDGTATSKELYLGSYQVKEICQPEGYVLADKTWDVELKYKDESTELVYETLEITNVLAKVVIEKTVKDSDEKLSGVQFAFWKQMTDGLDDGIAAKETVKTNKNGQAVIEGLKPDTTYCIKEVEGIDGYAIDDRIFEVKVGPDGKIEGKDSITVTVENAKTEITETNAISSDTDTQQGLPKKEAVIQDKVSIKNLQKGETYLLKGVLMDAETQLPLQISGKEIAVEKSFTAEKDSMEIPVEFRFDASACAGKTIVVYERLFLGEKEISIHTDLNDKKQTVTFPKHEIGTKARDQDTGTQEAIPKKEVTILDEVSYQNLIVGQEYTVKGVLMSKQTGQPLLVDGKEIRAEKKFRPEKPDGSVELSFTFDASELQGESVVVFEHLYVQGTEVAVHADLEDQGQTVTFPKPEIGTQAKDRTVESRKEWYRRNPQLLIPYLIKT